MFLSVVSIKSLNFSRRELDILCLFNVLLFFKNSFKRLSEGLIEIPWKFSKSSIILFSYSKQTGLLEISSQDLNDLKFSVFGFSKEHSTFLDSKGSSSFQSTGLNKDYLIQAFSSLKQYLYYMLLELFYTLKDSDKCQEFDRN
jgi:hypothetical protein